MTKQQSKMRSEIEEIPNAIQQLIDKSELSIKQISKKISNVDPHFITTIARGSSDHGANFLKYAFEINANIVVASLGPSIASIYHSNLKLNNTASLIISQSGESPDILQMAKSAKKNGAHTIAITNNINSSLAKTCNNIIDIQAGEEKSVAATKTFINSIIAGLLLLAHWKKNERLLKAIYKLPQQAAKAIECDWSALGDRLVNENKLLILGRGPSFAIANEVALKFKETCQINAQAYSSAELLHGPVSIVTKNFPILSLVCRDASQNSILKISEELANMGADVFITSTKNIKANELKYINSKHDLIDSLLLIISFYSFIEILAILRGLNPDLPPNLQKVTKTL